MTDPFALSPERLAPQPNGEVRHAKMPTSDPGRRRS